MKTRPFLIIFLILCLGTTLPLIKGQAARQKVYVDPQNNAFSTTTTSVGTNFTVNIKAADFASPGVFSYEMKLAYNNTMLEAVAAEIPADHWLKPSKPTNIFPVDPGTINQTLGFVSFALTMLGDEQGKIGAGTISKVTFKITQAPTVGNLSCTLLLQDVILVDPNTVQMPQDQYDLVNGNYLYTGAPPPPVQKPKVYVDPKDTVFLPSNGSVGTNFTVSIKAFNWTAPGIFSYQLELHYNNSLLEAVTAQIPTEHFLKPSTAANIFLVDPGTINQTLGFVSFAATLLGSEQGKTGSGTISTVTFRITQAPPTDQNISCPLELANVVLVDPNAAAIPPDTFEIVNGNYLFSAAGPPTKTGDLNGDGKVNIEDVATWGLAFGSYAGHPRWNPIADINGDGRVDMIDAVLIARAFTAG